MQMEESTDEGKEDKIVGRTIRKKDIYFFMLDFLLDK